MIMSQPWISAAIVVCMLQTVNVEFAMPMGMFQQPPPMYMMAPPPPPPMGLPMPFPVPLPVLVTKKPTTTTASPHNESSKIPVPVPIPLPFSFPMPFMVPQAPPPSYRVDRPSSKQCPPCQCAGPPPPFPLPMMPAPMPMPMPMPMYPPAPPPPSLFYYPFPPMSILRRQRRRAVDCDSSDTDTDDTNSSSDTSDSDWRGRRRRGKPGMKIHPRSLETDEYRARFRRTGDRNNKLVKPVLTYVSDQGKVKFQKRISERDADRLMKDSDRSQDSQSVEISRRSGRARKDNRRVLFRAPPSKSITDLSVSFNIA